MAGHSKWSNIKHKKARVDAAKGKVFSRITKEIISAVQQGGDNPKHNVKLRLALQKAKTVNMPQENIQRNIKKASDTNKENYSSFLYELYGFGGVGLLAEGMTDNRNRIASDMRIVVNKKGGSIASPGSVQFNFQQKGVFYLPKEGNIKSSELFLLVSDFDVEDFDELEDEYIVTTPVDAFDIVQESLEKASIVFQDAKLAMQPKTFVSCSSEDMTKNIALIEALEMVDDVDEVFHNMAMEGK